MKWRLVFLIVFYVEVLYIYLYVFLVLIFMSGIFIPFF